MPRTLECLPHVGSNWHFRSVWQQPARSGGFKRTWVAHLIQAGMRSTHSPYAVSTLDFTFVLRTVNTHIKEPCTPESMLPSFFPRMVHIIEQTQRFLKLANSHGQWRISPIRQLVVRGSAAELEVSFVGVAGVFFSFYTKIISLLIDNPWNINILIIY